MIYYLYQLLFPNGKRYIGISKRPERRCHEHAHAAVQGRDFPLHRAIRKHGWNNVNKNVLVCGEKSYISSLEVRAINIFGCRGKGGYNVSFGGDLSPMLSQETRLKQSASLRGFKHSAEACANMGASHLGRKHSNETREKMSHAQKGRTFTQESIEKMRKAHTGKVVSAATRIKQGNVRRGRKHSLSTRMQIRSSNIIAAVRTVFNRQNTVRQFAFEKGA